MEIYTFDKSLQERLLELSEILSNKEEIVSASRIQTEWSYHIEFVIEPVGWQALWKISRSLCQEFGVHYPTIVVVEVEQVNFAELCAVAKIIAVQDDIHLPEKYDVPLIELYPLINQENTALDIVGTARCIDQLRFFYNYLWMPWDIDDDETADWVSQHLETRLRLFFDMKRGIVSKDTCDVIYGLIREGKDIHEKISLLEESIPDEEELQDCSAMDEGKACELMKLHFRLQQIKAEMEILENPVMREVLAKNHSSFSEKLAKNCDNDTKKEGYLVWLGGLLEEMKEIITKTQLLFPQDLVFKTSGSLQEALLMCDANDIIALGKGNHPIGTTGGLEKGGTIKGIYDMNNTVISPRQTENMSSLLDFSGDEVLLENICVDLGELQVGVIVRKGIVKLNNCKIFVNSQNIVKTGIVVFPGAKLITENVIFDGLGTAIAVYSTSEVIMKACCFQNCSEGIQMHENAKLTAEKCSFGHFTEYAIHVETQKYLKNFGSRSGSTEIIDNIKEISLRDCLFENNGKADVILRSRGVDLKTQTSTAN